jgi:hypothetical protein
MRNPATAIFIASILYIGVLAAPPLYAQSSQEPSGSMKGSGMMGGGMMGGGATQDKNEKDGGGMMGMMKMMNQMTQMMDQCNNMMKTEKKSDAQPPNPAPKQPEKSQ